MRVYFSARGWRVDLPELDLPPGDYRERKPKGWRWKLPWSHDDDVKLPMVVLFVAVAILVAIFVTRNEGSRETLFGVTALFSFVAGIMFMLWQRD